MELQLPFELLEGDMGIQYVVLAFKHPKHYVSLELIDVPAEDTPIGNQILVPQHVSTNLRNP